MNVKVLKTNQKPTTSNYILGIDTSLRSTGIAVIKKNADNLSAVDFGTIKTSPKAPISMCLFNLHRGITTWIEKFNPGAVAIEDVFLCKNFRTAFVLGQATGVVISVCAIHSIPVYEYSAKKIKKAILGYGSADKYQIAKMIQLMLNLSEVPEEDAADALAIAICHANTIEINSALNKIKPV